MGDPPLSMTGTSKLPLEIGPLAGPYHRDSIAKRCPRQSFRVVAIAAEGGNAVKVIQPKGNREAREGCRV